jgi:hypothetical protein
MAGVVEYTLADKQVIGVILAAAVAAAAKVPRPSQFGTEALDILSLELRSSAALLVGSDNTTPVTIPAGESFFINVRFIAGLSSANISDTWIKGTADVSVIAHTRKTAYSDLG